MSPHSSKPRKQKIGLALGSGAARGWAHIGVLRALDDAGIRPDIICGTSIGAMVAAAYAHGDFDRLEEWVLSLTWQNVVSFLDFTIGGGLIKGNRLTDFFRDNFVDLDIQNMPIPFAAVATELETGREIWLRHGSVSEAVRASMAVPGLFTPVEWEGQWLVDGGLVNPVPVSLCRGMGADIVIGVDLNSDLIGRHLKHYSTPQGSSHTPRGPTGIAGVVFNGIRDGVSALRSVPPGNRKPYPSMLEVLAGSLNIMQVRITRSRLAGEPADVLIAPAVAHLALMDFHRAKAAIEAGRKAATHALSQIRQMPEGGG